MDVRNYLEIFLFFTEMYKCSASSFSSRNMSENCTSSLVSDMVSRISMQSVIVVQLETEDVCLQNILSTFEKRFVKYEIVNTMMGFERTLLSQMKTVLKYSHVEKMKENLNVVVFCDVINLRRLLNMAEFLDKSDGYGLLLRHYSKWIIVPSDGENLTNGDIFFENTIIVSRKQYTDETTVRTLNGDILETLSMANTSNIYPNIGRGFNGREFLVLAMHWDVFTREVRTNDTVTFDGISRSILDVLASKFNFTFRFIMPEDMSWGTPDDNGTWTGIVGMLQRKEADLCINPFSPNSERQKVMSFGYFFDQVNAVVIYKRKTNSPRKWMLLVSAFEAKVYLVGLLVVVLAAVMFICMEYGYNHSFKLGHNMQDVTGVIMHVLAAPLRQGYARPIPSNSSRMLLSFWCFFCIVTTSVYTGNLMASLAVSMEVVPFSTLEELVANTEYDLDVVSDTTPETILEMSNVTVFQGMWKKIERLRRQKFYENYIERLSEQKRRLHTGGYALIMSKTLGEVYMAEDCDLQKMKQTIFPAFFGFVYPRDSPLPKLFFDEIQRMSDTGLLQKWEKYWAPGRKPCGARNGMNRESLTISVLFTPLVACSVGIGAGILTLCAELCYKHFV